MPCSHFRLQTYLFHKSCPPTTPSLLHNWLCAVTPGLHQFLSALISSLLLCSLAHCPRLSQFLTAHNGKYKKVNVAHTRLPSVQFRGWSRFLAVSLQVTWIINPTVGCHYFLPGLQLPSRPLRGLRPISLLGELRHDGCEQFAQDRYPTAPRLRLEPRHYCARVQHAKHSTTKPPPMVNIPHCNVPKKQRHGLRQWLGLLIVGQWGGDLDRESPCPVMPPVSQCCSSVSGEGMSTASSAAMRRYIGSFSVLTGRRVLLCS